MQRMQISKRYWGIIYVSFDVRLNIKRESGMRDIVRCSICKSELTITGIQLDREDVSIRLKCYNEKCDAKYSASGENKEF